MKQQKYKPELQTRQVTLSIKVQDGKYCDEKCGGYAGGFCRIFNSGLFGANVAPTNLHFDYLVRCAKCRKAEIS